MSASPPGESASILPWFWPDAGSLALLAQSPVLPWADLREDPGAVFLILAHLDPLAADLAAEAPSPELLRHAAAQLRDLSVPWVDWRHRTVAPAFRTAIAAARLAGLIADYVGSCDPAAAWCGGLLATAGWLAVGVHDPAALAACVTAPNFAADPWGAQLRTWGVSRGDIAWRLAGAWKLPNWAKVLMGGLSYSPADADQLGGLARLHAVVQTAVALAEECEMPLGLGREFDVAEAHAELSLRSADVETIRARYASSRQHGWLYQREWLDPTAVPGLAKQLEVAADRLDDRPQTLPFPVAEIDDSLRVAKLEAMAEFAAGASHEINNPLAVISANSQYLLKQDPTAGQRKALESIIRQTERVHGILRELMTFARPPAPKLAGVDAGAVAAEAMKLLQPLADERVVRLDLSKPGNPVRLEADPDHLRNILLALVRNGVEAAGKHGYVRLKVAARADRIELTVEDSGPGPDETDRDHLFDPFYSGRAAGRGRGLGLPTAWQLARQHGGDVRYVPTADGPTRFVCTLPAAVPQAQPARKSA